MNEAPKKSSKLQSAINKLYVHDFKNPISAISANLSYLEAVIEDEAALEAISDSNLAMKSLLHMFDNFLNISRIEAGELISPEENPLCEFIESSVERCRGYFAYCSYRRDI